MKCNQIYGDYAYVLFYPHIFVADFSGLRDYVKEYVAL